MLVKSTTFRWSIIALCFVIAMLVFTVSMNTTQFRTKPIDKHNVDGVSSNGFDESLFSKLHVQEPVLNSTDVQHLSNAYDFAIMNPSLLWTEQDLAFFKSAAGETVFSQLALIPEAHEKPNFVSMTAAERLFKALFMYFDKILTQDPLTPVAVDHRETWELYKRLERTLYPWIYPYWDNAFHINNRTSGQGIVICVGNGQFRFAATTVRVIREVLNCDLPIEVFFIRDDDLSLAKRTYFQTEFSNISLMKLESYVSRYYTRFGGWAMKPFAMLASTFTEMIMMDADVFFLQNPALLFDDLGYQTTGSLFFYDRTLFANWERGPDWLRSFLPTMSTLVPKTRWFKGTSSHEQESGVVVMNKKKSLLGLLSTCKLNGITERDEVVYKHIHGDKETFWIGHEIMQTPYAFLKSFGAVIGNMGRGGDDGEPHQVCGIQLHLDTEDTPFWFNGGLYRNKYKPSVEYLNFTHFAEGEDWEFTTSCIKNTDKIQPLDPEQRKIALAAIEIDILRIKDQELIEQGLWKPKHSNNR